jgi:endo-1,4-beta-xylanase
MRRIRATLAAAFTLWGSILAGCQEASMPSLAQVYRPYFPVGAAVDPATIVTARKLLESQVSSLVAENHMKWERIHPNPGDGIASYNFSGADAIVAFAQSHGMLVRGHTLVWHQQVPGWVFQGTAGTSATKTVLLQRMKDHITTLLTHFRGKVYCWDVVNEALSDDGAGWRTASPWHQIAGDDEDGDGLPDYVVRAFEYARAADPGVKLFYNDFNNETGGKLEKTYVLAKTLKERGLIDGVGIQGHWSIHAPDPEVVRRAIDRIAALGLVVHITELDLSVYRWGDRSTLGGLEPALEDRQAVRYGELFAIFREAAAARKLGAVTFWGIADDHTWLDNFPVRGRKDWPLLFDTGHTPKKAFWSVAKW